MNALPHVNILPACRSAKRMILYCLPLLFSLSTRAQQNNTLFFMHSVPQANFLNPAVQLDCRIFIGLPVISSVHINLANSGFTLEQLLERQADSSYAIDADYVSGKLAARNFLATEIHTTLLAAGYRHNDYYFTFSVNEKDNALIVYQRDAALLALQGNTLFEGETVSLKNTGVFFNHYREYALGVSKRLDDTRTIGVRAKLLFGKLNMETRRMNTSLYTEENTFNLLFDVDSRVNASLPYSLTSDGQGSYDLVEQYAAPWTDYALNRNNPGFALDLGFLYRYSDNMVFSGSILDLGFVHYASNLTNYSLTGSFEYDGPLNDPIVPDEYFNTLFNELNANMQDELTMNNYYHFLTPRVLLGASREMSAKITVNALWYNRFHQMKYQSGIALSALARPFKNLETSLSWSYMNRSALNLGFGIAYGRSPLQFYLVSDNLLAPLLPMHTKNLNLRFGLNILLGCRERREEATGCGCYWIQQAEEKRKIKEKKLHRR